MDSGSKKCFLIVSLMQKFERAIKKRDHQRSEEYINFRIYKVCLPFISVIKCSSKSDHLQIIIKFNSNFNSNFQSQLQMMKTDHERKTHTCRIWQTCLGIYIVHIFSLLIACSKRRNK